MDIVNHIEYNIWANRLIMAQIESLPQSLVEQDFGGSFGSMKGILIHLLESDWIWLNRWKGIPLAEVPQWKLDDAVLVNKQWKVIQDEMLTIARTFTDSADRKIEFLTRKGAHYVMPFNDIVIHVTNHGTYHRGQLAHMIRTVGQKPVSTDYFIFCTQ